MNESDNTIRRISTSYWMGQDTFVVEFNREFTTSDHSIRVIITL